MKRVLIIDENYIDASLIEALMNKFVIDVVQSVGALKNLLDEKAHLAEYDCIFMDPTMDPSPFYSMKLSASGTQTGWLLYQDYMKEIPAKVLVWSNGFLDMYEDLFWGNNVVFFRKNLQVSYMVDAIDFLLD